MAFDLNNATVRDDAPHNLWGSDKLADDAPDRYSAAGVSAMLVPLLQSSTPNSLQAAVATAVEKFASVIFVKPGQNISAAASAQAAAGGGTVFMLPGTHTKITAGTTVSCGSNVLFKGSGRGVTFVPVDPDINPFLASGVIGAGFEDFTLTCATAGTEAYKGGIFLLNSSKCEVRRVAMDGLSWGGVVSWDSADTVVDNCDFSNWRGNLQDSADIHFYGNSNYNTAINNRCFGGGDVGVSIYNPYVGATPTGNRVLHNKIGQHRSYGVMAYNGDSTYDAKTLIAHNNIKDIQGAGGGGGVGAGAGIYVVSMGGVRIDTNQVNDCTQATTNFGTLGAAGITISDCKGWAVIAIGNEVTASRGPCMSVVSSGSVVSAGSKVSLVGNTCRASNSDATHSGYALVVTNSPGTKMVGNSWTQDRSDLPAVAITASGIAVRGTKMVGDTVETSGYGIQFSTSSGGTYSDVELSGVTVDGANVFMALDVAGATGLRIIGGEYSSTTYALKLTDCPNGRVTGAHIKSTYSAAASVFTVGDCAGTIIDESAHLDVSIVSNAGGALISQYADAVPSGWTSSVGDRLIRKTATVGSWKGQRYTSSGWVSEGNL